MYYCRISRSQIEEFIAATQHRCTLTYYKTESTVGLHLSGPPGTGIYSRLYVLDFPDL